MMVKQANLALALVLELSVLVVLAYWGFATGATIPVKIVLVQTTSRRKEKRDDYSIIYH
jgi:uncharacterized protein DUF2568